MFKKINTKEISRNKVRFSMIIPFSMVFLIIFTTIVVETYGWAEAEPVKEFFEIFAMTSPSWLLSISICLILQYRMIKKGSSKKQVKRLLIYETLVASALSLHVFLGILIIGSVANILRYQWLIYKGRMYR